MILALAAFAVAIVVFSNAYNSVLRFFEQPTELGLIRVVAYVLALIAVLAVLGLIMYATERRLGNVKVKNAFFERLLGYPPDSQLPSERALATKPGSQGPRKEKSRQ